MEATVDTELKTTVQNKRSQVRTYHDSASVKFWGLLHGPGGRPAVLGLQEGRGGEGRCREALGWTAGRKGCANPTTLLCTRGGYVKSYCV